MLFDFIGALLFLPTLCLCFYAVERLLAKRVEKKKRAAKLRVIRSRRRELASELSRCA